MKDAKSGWLSTKTSPVSSLIYTDKEAEKRNLIDIKFSDEGNAQFVFKGTNKDEKDSLAYNDINKRFARYAGYKNLEYVQVYRRYVAPVVVENLTYRGRYAHGFSWHAVQTTEGYRGG